MVRKIIPADLMLHGWLTPEHVGMWWDDEKKKLMDEKLSGDEVLVIVLLTLVSPLVIPPCAAAKWIRGWKMWGKIKPFAMNLVLCWGYGLINLYTKVGFTDEEK